MNGTPQRLIFRLGCLLAAPMLFSPTFSGPGVELQVGFGAFNLAQGSRAPAMSALFRLVNPDGILVSEAGVGAVPAIRGGRIFVQEDSERSTGLALANLSESSVDVDFRLFDAAGVPRGQSELTLVSQEQRARFVSEMFPELPRPFVGTLLFEIDGPTPTLGAVTIRQGTNASDEPIFATLPVAELEALTSASGGGVSERTIPAERLIFPQIGAGGGLSTQIVLFSNSAQPTHGSIVLAGSDGTPLELQRIGVTASEFAFQIPAQGVFFAELTNPVPDEVGVGYASITVEPGSSLPSGSAIFRFVDGESNTISEAGVGAAPLTERLRVFVDGLRTRIGVAVANPHAQINPVEFDLLDAAGTVISTAPRDLPANGHAAVFADEIFDLADDFLGAMEIRSELPVAPVTLKLTTNQRGQSIITSLPVADLENPPADSALIVPQVGVGASSAGEFTTRLISVSTDLIEPTTGSLGFWTGLGQPWEPAQVPSSVVYGLGAGEIGELSFEVSSEPLIIQRGNSASASMGFEGGIITVENNRGDVITLEIPPFSLLSTETITVTALTAPPKRFFSSNIFPGVLLEPEGLVLNERARLRIELFNPPDRPERSMVFWLADPEAALAVPVQSTESSIIEAEIQHFSAYSGYQVTLEEATLEAHFVRKNEASSLKLDKDLAEFLVEVESWKSTLQHDVLQQMLGAESVSLNALGGIEQATQKFLGKSEPEEPCGLYHALLPKLTGCVEDVGDSDLTQAYKDRIQSLDQRCIDETVAGTWDVSSTDAFEECRIVAGCTSGCSWAETDDDEEVEAVLGQQGSQFTLTLPAFPDLGALTGQINSTGDDEEPFFFTVKIASVNTLDCKIFFETQGLGIDFGAPICGSGSTCVPNACFERQTLSGVFGSDLTSARGVEQWDFEATVTETLEGATQVFRYRCKGDANFTATKQEPDEEATDGTSRPRAPGRTKGQE